MLSKFPSRVLLNRNVWSQNLWLFESRLPVLFHIFEQGCHYEPGASRLPPDVRPLCIGYFWLRIQEPVSVNYMLIIISWCSHLLKPIHSSTIYHLSFIIIHLSFIYHLSFIHSFMVTTLLECCFSFWNSTLKPSKTCVCPSSGSRNNVINFKVFQKGVLGKIPLESWLSDPTNRRGVIRSFIKNLTCWPFKNHHWTPHFEKIIIVHWLPCFKKQFLSKVLQYIWTFCWFRKVLNRINENLFHCWPKTANIFVPNLLGALTHRAGSWNGNMQQLL